MSLTSDKTTPVKRNYAFLIPFISALLIVLLLSFMDEGNYNFSWLTDPGSWAAFGIYMVIFFVIQSLIYNFVLSFLKGVTKNIIMLVVITPLIFLLVLWLFF